MKIKHKEDYRPLRAASYPNMGEQIGAIAKGFNALKEQGFELPQETLDWLESLEEVKLKYRKN